MLPKKQRLTKKRLAYVFRKGQRFGNAHLNVRFIKNFQPHSRFSITVSAKISKKAVERNLLRRRIYEIIRLNPGVLPQKYDIALITKPSILTLNFENLKKTTLHLLKNIH